MVGTQPSATVFGAEATKLRHRKDKKGAQIEAKQCRSDNHDRIGDIYGSASACCNQAAHGPGPDNANRAGSKVQSED